MKLEVLDSSGKTVNEIEVDDAVFAIDPNAARSSNVKSMGDLQNAARSDHRIYRRP